MESIRHEFSDLFEQLGLPHDEASIREFCSTHKLTDEHLADADFWTPSQKQFLREAITMDADWVVPIDQLNTSLRH